MVKIAIISDLHANIKALNLVLKDIEKRNVDKIICLGDLVTKYFYPAEVVDAIKANSCIVLKGNCDDSVTTNENYRFARSKLGLERIEYLENLPIKEQIMINKTLLNLFHSTPETLDAMFNPVFNDNEHTRYKDQIVTDYNKMFLNKDPQVSIAGHTHQDYIGVEKEGNLEIENNPAKSISNKERAIVNVGSAGEHSHLVKKDGIYVPIIDPYLTYAIVDDNNIKEGINVQIIKIPYKDTLKNVYFNMVDMQRNNTAPFSPNDTQKVYDSLLNMGYSEEEINKRGR